MSYFRYSASKFTANESFDSIHSVESALNVNWDSQLKAVSEMTLALQFPTFALRKVFSVLKGYF